MRRGDRGRLAQLVQLRPPGRGGAGGRRPAPYLVDFAHEIDEAWLDGVAHGRRHLRRERARGAGRARCSAFLAERGFPEVEEVHSAEESLIFSLPQELRRDLRGRTRTGLSGQRG